MIGPRFRAGLVLLFVFAAGVLAGMFFERHHALSLHASMSPADLHAAAMVDMREALDLDDRQVEQIHAIMSERQQLVEHLWEQLRPEVQSAMREVHAEIADLLRPDQRERFHSWLAERREQDVPD